MQESFWRERWGAGQIGFHEGRANALLAEHADTLAGRARILVPLCGKAHDLRFLRDQGHEVVGVEFVREAAEAFFREQGIAATEVRLGALGGLTGGGITILVGDFFLASASDLGSFDGLYDRAALVALEPRDRARYTRHCLGLLAPGAIGLVITFEYDQAKLAGPPFSVDDASVRSLYAGCAITELGRREEAAGPKFVQVGIPSLIERLHLIRTP